MNAGQSVKRACRTLIVEPELLVAWRLEGLLSDLGYESAIAHAVKAAESLFQELEPELVLIDIDQEDPCAGINLARRLLAHRKAGFVFISSFDSPELRDAVAQAAIASPVLLKPVSPADLAQAVAASRLSRA